MARLFLHVSSTVGTTELAMGNPKTMAQIIAAANDRVAIQGVGLSAQGTNPSDAPVLFQVLTQSTAIGGTPGAATVSKKNESDAETIQTTATIYGTAPTEPTAGAIKFSQNVHAQGPFYILFPPGQELIIYNGGRAGLRTVTALTYGATAEADLEE